MRFESMPQLKKEKPSKELEMPGSDTEMLQMIAEHRTERLREARHKAKVRFLEEYKSLSKDELAKRIQEVTELKLDLNSTMEHPEYKKSGNLDRKKVDEERLAQYSGETDALYELKDGPHF